MIAGREDGQRLGARGFLNEEMFGSVLEKSRRFRRDYSDQNIR
jgi:hypothetical protein